MIRFSYRGSFLKIFHSLDKTVQQLILFTLGEVRSYYQSERKVSYGLRVKKLYANRKEQIFEGRVNLSLRVLWTKKKDEVQFTFIGDHDEVRNFIKGL